MKRLTTLLLVALGVSALSSCTEAKRDTSVQGRLRQEFGSALYVSSYRTKGLAAEGPFARMIIAKLGVDLIVAEGTTGESLRAGAGHYVQSSFPGDIGNVAIAGVRDGEGGPFRHLDQLTEGDEVVLIVPDRRFIYGVVAAFGGHANPWVTTPNDLSTLAPTDHPALTLTTNDPPETSRNRLIVRLRLVRSESLPG